MAADGDQPAEAATTGRGSDGTVRACAARSSSRKPVTRWSTGAVAVAGRRAAMRATTSVPVEVPSRRAVIAIPLRLRRR